MLKVKKGNCKICSKKSNLCTWCSICLKCGEACYFCAKEK